MKTSKFSWVLSVLAAVAGIAVAEDARADHCKLFVNADGTGTTSTPTLSSDVTATSASGSPNDSSWASTSVRRPGTSLSAQGVNNNVSKVQIVATLSDVAAYIFDGADFNGDGRTLYCRKGSTCTFTFTDMNDRTSSLICQREFFRKSFGSVVNEALNPIIPMSSISAQVDAKVEELLGGNGNIDDVRHTWSEDDRTTWSRTAWMNATDYCRRRGDTACATDVSERMNDMMRISKRFEVDLNVPIEVFSPDDDYIIALDWYVRPVLAGDNFQLRFWWASTTWWVEEGTYHNRVMDAVVPAVNSVNIQSELRNGVLQAAEEAGCAACIDNKRRLQMAYFEDSDVGRVIFSRAFNSDATPARIVLTLTRDAVYP